MSPSRTLTYLVLAACAGACALGGQVSSSNTPGADAGAVEDDSGASAPDPNATDASAPLDGSPASRDSSTDARDAASSAHEAGPASGACGVCDRTWICNGISQYWATEADGRCVNQVNHTGLRCDGVLDGTTVKNVGTWTGDTHGLSLNFQNVGGGSYVIVCTP